MKIFSSTRKWQKFWVGRKVDWKKSYLETWNHPHRYMISGILSTLNWMSLFEIGCGAGANLVNIIKSFPNKTLQLGGCDPNKDAVKLASETLQGAILKVGTAEDIFVSDKFTDITLSDRVLIYVSPRDIGKYLKEMLRITRNHVVLCEFYEKSWWKRLKLRWSSGYFAHNYPKILQKLGFYDIMLYKIPPELWPGDSYPSYIIVAKVPSR